MVAASSAGATRAAITYSNNAEQVDFSTSKLSVDIQELQDGKYVSVSDGNLTFPGIAEEMNTNDDDKTNDIPFKVGKQYPEAVQVVNTSTGKYSEYVRVMVRRSWTESDGETKDLVLDPSLIQLGVNTLEWIEDESDATTEGQAFYCKKPLGAGESSAFLKTITIDNKIVNFVKTVDAKDENGNTITGTVVNEYKYDNKRFFVELRVDAVQAHNASEAILGAWGVEVSFDGAGNITSIN